MTAVCSTHKIEMIRSISQGERYANGADHIIDYTQIDVTKNGQQYDLILDAAAYRSVFDYAPILKPDGTYVLIGGSISRLFQVLLFGSIISRIMRRKLKCLMAKPNRSDLVILKEMIEAGKVMPFIVGGASPLEHRTYSLSEVPMAIRQLEQRQVQGKVAISV